MRATTEAGTTVLLYKDGTWTPAEPRAVESKEGFRKAPWGASVVEVKALEAKDPSLEESDCLIFGVELGRFSCQAVYIFVGNQLVRGKYIVVDEYQNQTRYLTAYDELKDSVSKKYGTPAGDETYWLNDHYKDDYSNWGMAVGCGDLRKFANWETPESTVHVSLMGENFDVHVSIEYVGKAFEKLESSVREANLLSDL